MPKASARASFARVVRREGRDAQRRYDSTFAKEHRQERSAKAHSTPLIPRPSLSSSPSSYSPPSSFSSSSSSSVHPSLLSPKRRPASPDNNTQGEPKKYRESGERASGVTESKCPIEEKNKKEEDEEKESPSVATALLGIGVQELERKVQLLLEGKSQEVESLGINQTQVSKDAFELFGPPKECNAAQTDLLARAVSARFRVFQALTMFLTTGSLDSLKKEIVGESTFNLIFLQDPAAIAQDRLSRYMVVLVIFFTVDKVGVITTPYELQELKTLLTKMEVVLFVLRMFTCLSSSWFELLKPHFQLINIAETTAKELNFLKEENMKEKVNKKGFEDRIRLSPVKSLKYLALEPFIRLVYHREPASQALVMDMFDAVTLGVKREFLTMVPSLRTGKYMAIISHGTGLREILLNVFKRGIQSTFDWIHNTKSEKFLRCWLQPILNYYSMRLMSRLPRSQAHSGAGLYAVFAMSTTPPCIKNMLSSETFHGKWDRKGRYLFQSWCHANQIPLDTVLGLIRKHQHKISDPKRLVVDTEAMYRKRRFGGDKGNMEYYCASLMKSVVESDKSREIRVCGFKLPGTESGVWSCQRRCISQGLRDIEDLIPSRLTTAEKVLRINVARSKRDARIPRLLVSDDDNHNNTTTPSKKELIGPGFSGPISRTTELLQYAKDLRVDISKGFGSFRDFNY